MTLKQRAFKNIVGKRENAFPTVVSTLPRLNFNSSFTFTVSSANDFNLHQSKFLSFGKELMTLEEKDF